MNTEFAFAEMTPCGKLAILNEKWECSVPNMYFIGTSMQQRDRRAASSFIHGFRYGVKSLFSILEEDEHSVPLPRTSFGSFDLENFVKFLIGWCVINGTLTIHK